MNDRLKNAFNKIHAEEQLKDSTKAFLSQKTKGYQRAVHTHSHRLIPAAACFLLLLFSGCWLYFTPTVAISIDVNPSIELGVNRFDRVVSIRGFNSDGQELAHLLNVKYLSYTDAIHQILTNEKVGSLLSNGEIMTIGVIGADNTQSNEVLSAVKLCTAGEANAYCYSASSSALEEAHKLGLSYGKYRAYLELQSLDPTITAEEVQNMTMKEILDFIDALAGSSGTEQGAGNRKNVHETASRWGNEKGHRYSTNGTTDS